MQRPVRGRVVQVQVGGMKQEPLGGFEGLGRGVQVVTENRMAQFQQVQAKLVRPAGPGFQFQAAAVWAGRPVSKSIFCLGVRSRSLAIGRSIVPSSGSTRPATTAS